MPKEYIDREAAVKAVYQYLLEQTVSKYATSELCIEARGAICRAMDVLDDVPAADVAPVVHGDIERERIEAILKKHGTYILSTIDGQGCHVGCFKGIALDADAKWIVEVDVESTSETNCGDFIPVVHGEWISDGDGYCWCYKCSVCGWKDGYPFNDRHKFCPNCGAKMKEEQ